LGFKRADTEEVEKRMGESRSVNARHRMRSGSEGAEALESIGMPSGEDNSRTVFTAPIRLEPVVPRAFEAEAAREPRARDRYRAIGLGLALTDGVCILIALMSGYFARFNSLRPLNAVAITAASILWVAVFRVFGVYAPHRLSPEEEFRRILGASSMGVILIVFGTSWVHLPSSRLSIGLTFFMVVTLELVARRGWRRVMWRLRKNGWLSFRTIVIADGPEIETAFSALSRPGTGFSPVGYVSPPEGPQAIRLDVFDAPLLGSLDELDSIIVEQGADCLFVARTSLNSAEMLKVVQAARRHGAELRLLANLPEVLTSRVNIQQIGDVTSLALKSATLTGVQSVIKRLSDIVISVIALVTLSPLLGVVALLVRVTSSGPVLFRQTRITAGGRPFTMYKFRTMVADADHILSSQTVDKTVPFFKLSTDSLLSPIGRFLRRTSLDELPQLFNVLKGEMSLVGPRPLPAEQVRANLEVLGPRHEVRAGMTGWWQINGRSILDVEQSVRMDLFYIENWSLSLDLFILLKTFGALFARRGAY
jgi:exopolysaccharide biosynthesis polyprenyl glycosylphosphotransferase